MCKQDEKFLAEQGVQALEEAMWRKYQQEEEDAKADIMGMSDDEYEQFMEKSNREWLMMMCQGFKNDG